jgi:hypothetical protein
LVVAEVVVLTDTPAVAVVAVVLVVEAQLKLSAV